MGTTKRNYSISQKHHLPFVNQGCHGKCFSFNTGLAGGGSSTDCTTEMYPLFLYMLLFTVLWGLLDGVTIVCEGLAVPVMYVSDLSPYRQSNTMHHL